MISDRIQERTIDEITNAFLSIGYRDAFVQRNYDFSDFLAAEPTLRTISLAVFGQEPTDYRSACFGLEFASEISSEIVANQLRALGAPQIFLVQNGSAQWWINREKKVVFKENIATGGIVKLIEDHAEDWKPEKIMRLKSGFKEPIPQQLDFIDLGLLPALEHQASLKIDSLIGRILYNAEKELERKKILFDATSVFNVVFRLLTAKILRDKGILSDDGVVSNRPLKDLRAFSQYYGEPKAPHPAVQTLPMQLLEDIGNEISSSLSLRNLSVDTLAYVYENTFVSRKSRKSLGIHSTPSYVAEYALAQLPIEDMPRSKWHFLDPMCGHGIFLIAAMRRMRSLLPLEWSGKQRHQFFVKRLHGIEIEAFSVEIARLCITLADFPQTDGWDLRIENTFTGKSLDNLARETSVIVGNPPFETIKGMDPKTPKPKELLRRILPKLPINALLGLVLPISFLDGSGYRGERETLHKSFDILSITTLPDRVFKHSDAETAILIARKSKTSSLPRTICRSVGEGDIDRFRLYSVPTSEDVVPSSYFEEKMGGRLLLPPLREIWEKLEENPRLGDLVDIETGVEYELGLLKKDPSAIFQGRPFANAVPGILNVTRGFKQFSTCDVVYMSTKEEHRRKMISGAWKLEWRKPKVIIPKSRMSRGPWRFAAVIDRKGLLVSRRFFAVWPKESNLTVEFLAALLNSPFAQAFVYAHTRGRDIPKRIYANIPVPYELKGAFQLIIDKLVGMYLQRVELDAVNAKNILLKIDAEILNSYDLPIRLKRQLLDEFSGHQRPVPFYFKGCVQQQGLLSLPSAAWESKNYLTKELSNFCKKKGILEYLNIAMDIIRESFASVRQLSLSSEQDPETDEQWILIDIAVDGPTGEVLKAYDRYIDQWVSAAPESVRETIKLSYRIF